MPRRPAPSIEKWLPEPRRGEARPRNSEAAYYQKLAQVSVRDTYYAPTYECPDFTAAPTVSTAAMMHSIGLLFRSEPTGFSVLYDRNRQAALFEFLRHKANVKGEHWTRLSFELALRNHNFPNFTKVPNDLDPFERNYYFSNQTAHERHGAVLLNRHRYVTGRELEQLVPVQFPVTVDGRVAAVVVRDISGAVVRCVPRCVPAALARALPAATIGCDDVRRYFSVDRHHPRERWTCRNTIYIDMAELREGRYVVQEVDRLDRVLREKHVLYASAQQYAFIDLLFTAPYEGAPGIYPVRGLSTRRPTVEPVQYELSFKRRSTYWRYYVVLPQNRRGGALAIDTEPPDVVTFDGPYDTVVGNATPASLFVAETPLPMSTRPPARFILKSGDGTLMESMPVASVQQILPEADSTSGGNPRRYHPNFRDYSDIYVYV